MVLLLRGRWAESFGSVVVGVGLGLVVCRWKTFWKENCRRVVECGGGVGARVFRGVVVVVVVVVVLRTLSAQVMGRP